MLKLASWNVNSLKVRLEQVLNWLDETNTDILALQETKLTDENFPAQIFTKKGFHISFIGQKTYNGVAIISRYPMTDIEMIIPDFEDPQRRFLAATIGELRLINLYVPNGSSVDSDKYPYKLQFLEKIKAYIEAQMQMHSKLAVVGDFNIAPEDIDVHDPVLWQGNVLVSPPERQAFQELLALGLIDSFRHKAKDEIAYSWWDYRQAAFRRNLGLRIDHILLSQHLNDFCKQSQIDKAPRKLERASDHAPVWVELDIL